MPFQTKDMRYDVKNVMCYNCRKAIPIKCFISHRPTDPFVLKSKKKKNQDSLAKDLQAHDLVLLTTIAMIILVKKGQNIR